MQNLLLWHHGHASISFTLSSLSSANYIFYKNESIHLCSNPIMPNHLFAIIYDTMNMLAQALHFQSYLLIIIMLLQKWDSCESDLKAVISTKLDYVKTALHYNLWHRGYDSFNLFTFNYTQCKLKCICINDAIVNPIWKYPFLMSLVMGNLLFAINYVTWAILA